MDILIWFRFQFSWWLETAIAAISDGCKIKSHMHAVYHQLASCLSGVVMDFSRALLTFNGAAEDVQASLDEHVMLWVYVCMHVNTITWTSPCTHFTQYGPGMFRIQILLNVFFSRSSFTYLHLPDLRAARAGHLPAAGFLWLAGRRVAIRDGGLGGSGPGTPPGGANVVTKGKQHDKPCFSACPPHTTIICICTYIKYKLYVS